MSAPSLLEARADARRGRAQAVHPSGKWILGPKNLAFMHGPEHKALRKSFLSLFTTKALGVYVKLQARPLATPARRASRRRRRTRWCAATWSAGWPTRR